MLDLWLNQVAPEISPAAVEVTLCGAIAGVEVHAIADVITTDGTVIDFKTASKKPAAIGADHAFQLTTYALLSHSTRARLVTITKTATPAVHQHTHLIEPADIRYAESVYPLVSQAMQEGLYLPRRTSNLCSRKHCAFWRQCEHEFGGEVRK
jgi:CRISPR/Cas system-associated exonuclease Cas4 (RecB family)